MGLCSRTGTVGDCHEPSLAPTNGPLEKKHECRLPKGKREVDEPVRQTTLIQMDALLQNPAPRRCTNYRD